MVMAIAGFAPVVIDFGTRDAIAQRKSINSKEIRRDKRRRSFGNFGFITNSN